MRLITIIKTKVASAADLPITGKITGSILLTTPASVLVKLTLG